MIYKLHYNHQANFVAAAVLITLLDTHKNNQAKDKNVPCMIISDKKLTLKLLRGYCTPNQK